MSYQPLHHKYRPQAFAELVGQEAIATTLTNALRQQRIAPAYLFTGARGTGKTSSARILAKSLNCLASDDPTEKPCGVCDVCRTIAAGSALDVIEIDAASNTGVDNIRELIERAQFAPVQCRYKVYIIDEVHMLSTAAFNALLKTLEEPPDLVVFVLATTDPQRVLPTIISRCQRFDFRRIPLDSLVQHLSYIAAKEGIPITSDAVQLVGQISQGGLRDAESLLDQLSLLQGEITAERVWDLVGAVPERDLMSLLQAIAQDNPETVLDQARRLVDRGREPLVVLQNLASFYRDLLIAKTAPQREDLVALTPPTWAQLCEFAQSLDVYTILAGQQHLRSSEVQLKHTTQPRLWLEVTLLGLLPSAIVTPSTVPQQPTVGQSANGTPPRTTATPTVKAAHSPSDRPTTPPPVAPPTERQPGSTPQPPVEPPAAPPDRPVATPAVTASTHNSSVQPSETAASATQGEGDLAQIWQQIIKNLQPMGTQTLLRQQGCLLGFNGQTARIGISSKQLLKMAQTKQPNIEAALEKVFHRPIKTTLEVAKPSEATAVATQPTTVDAAPNHPVNLPPPSPSVREAAAANPYGENVSARSSPPPPSVEAKAADLPQPTDYAIAQNFWKEDEVTQAAKRLAEFFGGKIVNMDEATSASSDLAAATPTPEPSDQSNATWENAEPESDEEDEDDLPF
jgi:DNA polymerase III subunit gamma/tau